MARIEVKYGSPTVTTRAGMSHTKVRHHAAEMAGLRKAGHEIVATASGATVAGRALHRIAERKRLLKPDESPREEQETDIVKRGFAGKGSAQAYMAFHVALARHGIETAQVPVTSHQIEDPEEGEALREILLHYLSIGTIPVANGNDAVSREGITDLNKSRDNDEVAAHIAELITVDHLCMLTNEDGLLDGSGLVVPEIGPHNIEWARSLIGPNGDGESGGMRSKLDAGFKTAGAGTGTIVHIANANAGLQDVIAGNVGTHIPPHNLSET
jgi:glutamate 5-kinase